MPIFLFLKEFALAEKKVYRGRYPELAAERQHQRAMRRIGWGFLIFCLVLVGLGAWFVIETLDQSSPVADQYRLDVPTEKIWTK